MKHYHVYTRVIGCKLADRVLERSCWTVRGALRVSERMKKLGYESWIEAW